VSPPLRTFATEVSPVAFLAARQRRTRHPGDMSEGPALAFSMVRADFDSLGQLRLHLGDEGSLRFGKLLGQIARLYDLHEL